MKVRNGYVSNSSSSSFLCNVCGRMESGYDASPSDFGMMELQCGHTICEHEKNIDYTLGQMLKSVKKDEQNNEFVEILKKEIEKFGEDAKPSMEFDSEFLAQMEEIYGSYDMPDFLCPICTMKVIESENKYKYLLHKFNLKDEDIEKEIKDKYNYLDDFLEDMKGEN